MFSQAQPYPKPRSYPKPYPQPYPSPIFSPIPSRGQASQINRRELGAAQSVRESFWEPFPIIDRVIK